MCLLDNFQHRLRGREAKCAHCSYVIQLRIYGRAMNRIASSYTMNGWRKIIEAYYMEFMLSPCRKEVRDVGIFYYYNLVRKHHHNTIVASGGLGAHGEPDLVYLDHFKDNTHIYIYQSISYVESEQRDEAELKGFAWKLTVKLVHDASAMLTSPRIKWN